MGHSIEIEGARLQHLRRVAGVLELVLELDAPLRAAYLDTLGQQNAALCRDVRACLEIGSEPPRPPGDPGATTLAEGRPGPGTPNQSDDQLGPYRLLSVLGSGGMGHVFLAQRVDGEVEQQVAIKVLGDGFRAPVAYQRFLSERQILAELDHPNIARMLDAGTTDEGRSYLVMEVIEGEPIERYCEQQALSLEDRLRLFQKVCSAVEHAHQRLVVHRDLKPSNILVNREGEPKLLDFGIAKLLDPATFPVEIAEVTGTALRPMTPRWASPEQLRGEAITTATDVYSLGLLLYRLLAGRLPHEGSASAVERIHSLATDEPTTRPSQAVLENDCDALPSAPERTQAAKKLKGDLDNIVLKALRVQAAERYASVAALRQDLESYLAGDPVTATRGTWRYRTGKILRRYRWPVSTAALFLLGALSFAGAMTHQNRLVVEQRDRAIEAESEAQVAATHAEQTRDFLSDLLSAANDEERLGRNLELIDLLRAGRKELHKSPDLAPEVQMSLAEALGDGFSNLLTHQDALKMYTWASEIGNAYPPARSVASRRLFKQVDSLQANGFFQESLDLLNRASDSGLTTLEFSAKRYSTIAHAATHQGNFDLAYDAATQAISAYQSEGFSRNTIREIVSFLGMMVDTGRLSLQSSETTIRDYWKVANDEKSYLLSPFYDFSYLVMFEDPSKALRTSRLALEHSQFANHVHDSGTAISEMLLSRIEGAGGNEAKAFALIQNAIERSETMLKMNSTDIRAEYHTALARLYRAEIYERQGRLTLMAADLEKAIHTLEKLEQETDIVLITNTYAMALLMLDHLDEARPVVKDLLERGWRRPDFMRLAKRKGALPDPLPPALDFELKLPALLQAELDSMPEIPLPWEPGGEEVVTQLLERLQMRSARFAEPDTTNLSSLQNPVP